MIKARHGRRHRRSTPITATVAVMIVLMGPATFAHAFKEKWHRAIVSSALSFLKPPYLTLILKEQDAMDEKSDLEYAGVDRWHFNDCDFEGASTLSPRPIRTSWPT